MNRHWCHDFIPQPKESCFGALWSSTSKLSNWWTFLQFVYSVRQEVDKHTVDILNCTLRLFKHISKTPEKSFWYPSCPEPLRPIAPPSGVVYVSILRASLMWKTKSRGLPQLAQRTEGNVWLRKRRAKNGIHLTKDVQDAYTRNRKTLLNRNWRRPK